MAKTGKKIIKTDGMVSQHISLEKVPAMLEDWKRYVGEDFSGDCVYETKFTMPENTQTCTSTIKFLK